ncbi:MAG: putative transport system permease protein [Kribbellaceae bacterium]|jgi:putative ABC transport system permease protein|nr:putative transport system permease protein [Kribbellaceae bacterium]
MSMLRGWGPPLRIARRTVRRSLGRTLLIAALIGLPVMGASWYGVVSRSGNPTGEALATQLIGRADAQLQVTSAPRITIGQWNYDGTFGYTTDPALGNSSRDPATVDLAKLLPPGSTLATRTEVVGTGTLKVGGTTGNYPVLTVDDRNGLATGTYKLDSGHLPQQADEVTLTPALASRLGLLSDGKVRTGAEIVAADGKRYPVVGLARPIVDPGQRAFWVAPGSPFATPGQDLHFIAHLPTGTDMATLQAQLSGHGIVLTPRSAIVDPPQNQTDVAASGVAVIALVIGFGVLEIVLLAGAAFAVGARRQTRELGLVTATGGTPRDVRRIVLAQGVFTGLLGAGGGLLLALGLAIGVRPLSEAMTGRLITEWQFPVGSLVLTTVIAAVAGLLAAVVPAVAAGRQTPMAALAGRFAVASRHSRLRVPALIMVGAGVGAVLLGSSLIAAAYPKAQRQAAADQTLYHGITPEGPIALVLLGITSVIAGLVWLLPNLIAKAASVGRFLPLSGRLALRDAARHRHRTGPATAAIMMAVAGTAAMAFALANSFAAAAANYVPEARDGDAVIRTTDYAVPGMAAVTYTPALADRVAAILPSAGYYPIATLQSSQKVSAGGGDYRPMLMAAPRPDARTSSGIPPTAAGVYAVDPGFLDRLGGFGRQAADALRAGKVVVPSKDFLTSDGKTLIGLPRDDGTITGKSVPAVVLPGLPDLLIFQHRPVSLASPEVARKLGTLSVSEVHYALTRDPTKAEQAAVATVLGMEDNLYVEHGYQDPSGTATIVLLGVATLVTLLGVAISVSLSAAEGRADLATLAAVGAKPRQRRGLAGAQAWLLGQVGCLLGVLVGALYGYTGHVAFGSPYFAVPWREIGGIVVIVPLFAGLLAWLITPSRLPMVRRAD